MLPRVTAILPSRNAANFIGDTLDALAAQTWPELEILIGDDASDDGTQDLLHAFAEKRDHVRLILRETNLGWIANTNDLMSRATGDFLFFAFHDDWVASDYVETLAHVLMARRDAVLAYSDLEQFEPDGKGQIIYWTMRPDAVTSFQRAWHVACRPGWWHVPNRGLFRAAAFHRIGGMKRHAAGEFAADWPWLLHLAVLGEFVHVPRTLCRKYYKTTSLTKVWRHGRDEWAAVLSSAEREVWNCDLPWAERALLVANLRTAHGGPMARRARRVARRLFPRASA
jgi:glycosyltransferase involved in cell wall biosynthesis